METFYLMSMSEMRKTTNVFKCDQWGRSFENAHENLPGANVRNEKYKEEDDTETIEPASHPAPYHTLKLGLSLWLQWSWWWWWLWWLRKTMQVTSLTGKQVSTDNSKVIGEEARARLKLKETWRKQNWKHWNRFRAWGPPWSQHHLVPGRRRR